MKSFPGQLKERRRLLISFVSFAFAVNETCISMLTDNQDFLLL